MSHSKNEDTKFLNRTDGIRPELNLKTNNSRKGCLVFTFDDGYETVYNTAKSVFDSKGVAGTAFVVTDLMNTPGYLSTAELLSLQTAGWEIGSHTKTHPSLVGNPNIVNELTLSKQALLNIGIISVKSLAYPYGNTSNAVRITTAQYYKYGREVSGAGNPQPIEGYAIRAYQSESLGDEATYKGYIDNAYNNNAIVVLLIHNVGSDQVTLLGDLIDYAQAKGMPILPMASAIETYGNIFETYSDKSGEITAVGIGGKTKIGAAREIIICNEAETATLKIWYDVATNQFKIQAYGVGLGINLDGSGTTFNNTNLTGALAIQSVLQIGAGIFNSTPYKLFHLADATSDDITFNLYSSYNWGCLVYVCKTDNTEHIINIIPSGAETIVGRVSLSLTKQGDSVWLLSYPGFWVILSEIKN